MVMVRSAALIATDDEWRRLGAAVLRAQEQGLLHIVSSGLQGDGDASLASGIAGSSPFASLSEGVVQALAFVNDDLACKAEVGGYGQ